MSNLLRIVKGIEIYFTIKYNHNHLLWYDVFLVSAKLYGYDIDDYCNHIKFEVHGLQMFLFQNVSNPDIFYTHNLDLKL